MSIADTQAQAEQLLHRAGILPVVTAHSVEQARKLAAALLRGGLGAIELTLRTPAALDALVALKRDLPDIAVGMGTVLDIEQMQRCIELGADFLVTPGTPPALAEALAKAPIPVVPGGATPSEFMALMARGFRVCKLFPATAVGGLAMIKGLAGPLAGLKLCPTGGIDEESAHEFLTQPNVICIGGSWMLPKRWVEDGDWDRIEACAAKAAAIVVGTR